MLTAGKNHNIKFKVNVMGTSAEPRVRLILGTSPELSFHANKDEDGWVSNMDVPAHIAPGDYDMRVEVHLNNRLFTPINKKINVKALDIPATPVPNVTAAPVPEPIMPTITALPVDMPPATASTQEPKAPVEMPKVVAKMPEIKPMKGDEPDGPALKKPMTREAGLKLLADIAGKEPKRMFERIVTPLPKPSDVKAKTISVSIADVEAITSPVTEARITEVPRIKRVVATPIKLIKEELFYE